MVDLDVLFYRYLLRRLLLDHPLESVGVQVRVWVLRTRGLVLCAWWGGQGFEELVFELDGVVHLAHLSVHELDRVHDSLVLLVFHLMGVQHLAELCDYPIELVQHIQHLKVHQFHLFSIIQLLQSLPARIRLIILPQKPLLLPVIILPHLRLHGLRGLPQNPFKIVLNGFLG